MSRRTAILAWLVPLLGVAELIAHFVFARCAPDSSDWAALGPALRALHQPGDLIVVAPGWADPLLRRSLGDSLLPLDVVARADDDGFTRALEVSFGGARSRALESWHERRHTSVGPFSVRVLNNPDPSVAQWSLLDHAKPPDLEVSILRGGTSVPCAYTTAAIPVAGGLGGDPTLSAQRFVCLGGSPFVVTTTIIDDERYLPRRCLWAHPNPFGPLRLLIHQITLGRKLVGHAGFPWLLSRDGAGIPVTITARVDGRLLDSVEVRDTQGWTRFEWPTGGLQGRAADLELRIESQEVNDQRLCFTLESR